jgi:ABC-type sugar transport system substrate-binding protein
MFRGLFGADDTTHSNVYAEAVRRGGYVVTVDVETDEERGRAEEIVRRFAPVNMEERSADWLRRGWRGHDPGSPSRK